MNFSFTRRYRGPLRLAIFDWAGTTVDHGSCAPSEAFIKGFKQRGVEITMAQARRDMGREKRDHIRAISTIETVAETWQKVHGRPMDDNDIDAMYQSFSSLLCDVLAEKSTVIDGVIDTVQWLRAQDLKIGASTGYFKEAAQIVAETAANHGYTPDFSICATEVPAGRPFPWMIYRVMEKLQVYPPEAVVNVGDTVVDQQTALNAGVWSVGVARTGNLCGLPRAEFEALPAEQAQSRVAHARQQLFEAGAHYVIDSVAELPDAVKDINEKLAKGETV